MKNPINRSHIEGYIYEHNLSLRVSGPNSKTPGTEFIMGELNIATDNDMINIIPVHFSYVTAITSKGSVNQTFTLLKNIIDGNIGTVMSVGKDKAGKVKIDSAIGLNDFYSDRNGKEELISAKRNEGGFVHTTDVIVEDEKQRNTFECDMIITNVRRVEGDPEKKTEDKVILKGATFDFRKAILPVEFSVTNSQAMDYFEGIGASSKTPVYTRVKGRQISQTVVREIREESAFGDDSVREVRSSYKDWVVVWAQAEPYLWDDASTITASELTEAMANRETYLATVKQRRDEYNANKNKPTPVTTATGGFDF